MREAGSRAHLVLDRRRLFWFLLAGMAATQGVPMRRAVAQPATPVAAATLDFTGLFPREDDLPAGLELESAGTREEIAQLAGTFRNSRDAAQLLADWGWTGNAYRTYVGSRSAGSAAPARVEISLHRFTTSTGAAYALSYLAHDRAVAFQQQETLGALLLPCDALVMGDGSVTRFLRYGNLVVRVTVTLPAPVDAAAEATAVTFATNLALAVLANARGTGPDQRADC